MSYTHLLACGIFLSLLSPALQGQEGERVGALSDLSRIQFQGLESYSRDRVLSGLLMTKSFREAIHPRARRDAFAPRIAASVEAVLRHAGHVEASVTGELDWLSDRVTLSVSEGPLYHQGVLRFEGIDEGLADQVGRRLRESNGLSWDGKQAFSSDPLVRRRFRSQMEAAFEEEGYYGTRLELVPALNREARRVDLLARIEELGRRALLHEIVWEGRQRSHRKAILDELGLRVGMPVAGDLEARLLEAIARTGNFYAFETSLERDPETEATTLHLYLEEDDFSTPLGEPRSARELAFEGAADWLSAWDGSHHDLEVVVSIQGKGVLRMVLGASGLVLFYGRDRDDGGRGDRWALMFSPEFSGLVDYEKKRRIGWDDLSLSLSARVQVTHDPSRDETSEKRGGMMFGIGVESEQEAPFVAEFEIDRVAARRLAKDFQSSGEATFRHGGGANVRFDPEGDRPLRAWHTIPELGRVDLSLRSGALSESVGRLAESTRTFQTSSNLIDLIDLVFEIVRSLDVRSLMPQDLMEWHSVMASSSELVTFLKQNEWTFGESVKAFWAGSEADRSSLFPPPSLLIEGVGQGPFQVLAPLVYPLIGRSAQLFPQKSWLGGLGAELLYFALGETRFLGESFQTAMSRFDAGPVAHLLMAQFLKTQGIPAAVAVADQGLGRLSRSRFRIELEAVTEGPSVTATTLRALVRDLQKWPPDRTAEVSGDPFGPERSLLARWSQASGEDPEGSLPDEVLEAWVDYAEARWFPLMERSLRSIREGRQ